MKAKCPVAGCDFVAEHPTQNYANVLLGKHKAKVHGIRSAHQIRYGGSKHEPKVVRKSEVPLFDQPHTPAVEPQVLPNFCPNCGCSMRAVTAALNLRTKR